MKGFRYLLPVVLASASFWWACDSRSVSQGGAGGSSESQVASVEVILDQTDIYYSQSNRQAITDTVDVLVLDPDRSALRDVSVQCGVESSFGGAVRPLTENLTNETGVARYLFTIQPSDQAFEGEQTVTFTASASGRTGQAPLTLHEQSDIQLSFLSPADLSLLYRMDDPAETMPVLLYAYRDILVGETVQRVGVDNILINFGVSAIGGGIPGTITAQGTTNSSGITSNVFYANAYEQPADTVRIEFSASLAGSSSLFTTSTVTLLNEFGYDLTITSPVMGSQLEIDSECLDENVTPVQATLRYSDTGNPIVGKNISFAASHGQITSTVITDANGIAQATWHDCNEADAGATLILTAIYDQGESAPVLSTTQVYPLDLPLGVPHHINVESSLEVLPDPIFGFLECQVIANVFNSQNQPLSEGLAVGFKTNGIGTITQTSFTNDSGEALASFTLNGQTGVSQVRAYYAKPNTTPAETLYSAPTLITINSGLPANLTLSTVTPRIQILGYGDASVALVQGRVVDAQGATVTIPAMVGFTLETSPVGVFLSLPGHEEQYFAGDTLYTATVDGIAAMTINAGRRPGVVQIGAFVTGDGFDVYSNAALVTILAGPPAYGTIAYDGVGDAPGAGIWRVRWSVHLWDQHSNDVEDSTAVYFYLDPAHICSFEGFGLTGVDADGEEGIRGIAEDWMTYDCPSIGDTLWHIVACSAGVVPIIADEDTTWVPGDVCLDFLEPDGVPVDPPAFWQLPFQAGDRDDNLTVVGQFTQVPFDMEPCGQDVTFDMTVRATLIDGYGCAVKDQQIQFWSDVGGTYIDPGDVIVTNSAGVAETVLQLSSSVLQNLGAECPDNPGCFTYGSYTLNFGAYRLPDGNPASNEASVILSRPCD